jgi:hypothetical protein
LAQQSTKFDDELVEEMEKNWKQEAEEREAKEDQDHPICLSLNLTSTLYYSPSLSS